MSADLEPCAALVVADPALPIAADLTAVADAAASLAEAARAHNTRRAYASDWKDFAAWCAAAGFPSLPADGRVVALYVTARVSSTDPAQRLSASTLARRLAAIRSTHSDKGLPLPHGPELRDVLAGMRRTYGRPPRPKEALEIAELRRVLQALPNTLTGVRDRAILLVGFGGLLRRSELAAITLEGSAAGPVRVRFVAKGLEVHIDRSKGDQEGRGQVVAIPNGSRLDTCPARALREWRDRSGIGEGPIFRSIGLGDRIGGRAIHPETVALIVKRSCAAVGLDPDMFAGHSLRSGMATSAADHGAAREHIQAALRHAKSETSERYIRRADMFKHSAAGKVL